jgi:phage terminase large subunit-like protein
MDRAALEKEYALRTEFRERRKNDGWWEFEPHQKQKEFIKQALEWPPKRFVAMLAANRSGKSDAGAFVGAALARFGNQSARYVGASGSDVAVRDTATSGWVVSLDFPSSRDIVQPKYFDNGFGAPGAHRPFIPQHEIERWDPQDQVLKLKNGSIVGFKSAESGRLKFQGADKDWVHEDEETPKDIHNEIVIRIGAGRRLRVFMTCTLLPPPGSAGGISWVYNEIVTAWKNGSKDISIVTASMYDNPHIPREEIEKLEAIYPEGSLERRIRLNGELLPTTAGARVYGNFDRALHVRKADTAILRKPLCWIWDFNVEPMVSLVGQHDNGVFKVLGELWLEQGNIPAMCDLFRRYYPTHLAEVRVYGDASGHQRSHQSNKSSYALIRAELMNYPTPIRVLVPDKNPSINDRLNAVNYALRDEDGTLNVEVDPACEQLITDLEQVISDGKGGIKKTTNRKDMYYWRTHASDALGYWIAYEAPVLAMTGRAGRTVKVPTPRYA